MERFDLPPHMSLKYIRYVTLSKCLCKDNVICEISSFLLAWTRSTCLQESPMAQFEAQDISAVS
jgi:hypothetical protein